DRVEVGGGTLERHTLAQCRLDHALVRLVLRSESRAELLMCRDGPLVELADRQLQDGRREPPLRARRDLDDISVLGLELARDAPNVLRSTRGEPPGIGAWAPLPEARDLVEHHGVVEICGGFDTQVLCRGMERGSSIVQRPGAGREILSPVAERSLVQRTDAQVVRATRRGRGL